MPGLRNNDDHRASGQTLGGTSVRQHRTTRCTRAFLRPGPRAPGPRPQAPGPRQHSRDGDETRMTLRAPTLSDPRSPACVPRTCRLPPNRRTRNPGDTNVGQVSGRPHCQNRQQGRRATARLQHHACDSCSSAARLSARSEFCRTPPARAAQAQLAPKAPTTPPAGPRGARPPLIPAGRSHLPLREPSPPKPPPKPAFGAPTAAVIDSGGRAPRGPACRGGARQRASNIMLAAAVRAQRASARVASSAARPRPEQRKRSWRRRRQPPRQPVPAGRGRRGRAQARPTPDKAIQIASLHLHESSSALAPQSRCSTWNIRPPRPRSTPRLQCGPRTGEPHGISEGL